MSDLNDILDDYYRRRSLDINAKQGLKHKPTIKRRETLERH